MVPLHVQPMGHVLIGQVELDHFRQRDWGGKYQPRTAAEKSRTEQSKLKRRRLFKIADALELPLSTFFEGCNISHQRVEESPLLLLALLAEPHAVKILKAFCQIHDMETRSALVDVVERLAVQR